MKMLISAVMMATSVLTVHAQADETESAVTDTTQWYNTTQELGEITVKGQQPKTKLTGNSLITRVKGSVLEHSGTVREMLAKVPGMMKNGDELEVIGRGTPIYYINGRRLQDLNELKRLRSEEILNVEVITNPGARYDAEVTAVVRIKTLRRQGEGFGFDVTLDSDNDLRYGHYDPSAQLDLHYRWRNFDVFGMANFGYNSIVQDTWLEQWSYIRKSSGDLLHIDQASDWLQFHRERELNTNLGFNWQINENHSVGMRIDRGGDCYDYDVDTRQDTEIKQWYESAPGAMVSTHNRSTQNNKQSKPYYWQGNAYYSGQAGKVGIDLNIDFLASKHGDDQCIREQYDNNPLKEMTATSPSSSKMIADKLVLSYPVWRGMLEAGTEMSFVSRKSQYHIDGMSLPTTDSKVTEDNIAAFVEYACQVPKVGSLSAGLRFEHVSYDYEDRLNADQSLSRINNDLFPSIAWSRQWGPVQTAVNYSLKTRRPSYWMLNETMQYINPYSVQQGNPKLKNEKIQQVGVNARWKWLMMVLNYTYKTDALTQWTYIYNDDGNILIKNINLDEPVRNLNVYFNASPTFGCFSPSWTAGLMKSSMKQTVADPCVEGGERSVSYHQPLYFLNLNNTFRFKHSWQLECNVYARSKGDYMNYRFRRNTLEMELALQKCWLKDDALCLRASVTDLFRRSRQLTELDCGYYQLHQNAIYNRHRFDLTLSYSFNAAKSKYRGTGAGREAQERMTK